VLSGSILPDRDPRLRCCSGSRRSWRKLWSSRFHYPAMTGIG
jgi:hypothetical protein